MNVKELVQYIAQAVVDNPDAVSVNEIEGAQATILELKVAKQDLGKIIGKQGRTAGAIRMILSSAAGKTKRRITLEIIE